MKKVICRYSEIALKKGNRAFFEKTLILNIKRVLDCSAIRLSGRILITTNESEKEIKEKLTKVIGLSSFSLVNETKTDLKSIQEQSLKSMNFNFKKFRVSCRRSQKDFPFSSQEINRKVGEYILKNKKDVKVDLENPEAVCYIEIVNKDVFVSTEKIKGINGLPVGSSGKAVSLISGGIDSPVASFQAMKRGLKLSFVHCHSYPETTQFSINKVKEIVKILSSYQGKSTLYLVPVSSIQKKINLEIDEKLRVVFLRLMMLKIAERIAEKEKSLAIITGDSLGQVASQTVENLSVTSQKINKLIIRPLVCYDKESIVKQAKEIGTFETSILPYEDCCARFLPLKPETKAKVKDLDYQEKRVNIEEMINSSLEKTEIIMI